MQPAPIVRRAFDDHVRAQSDPKTPGFDSDTRRPITQNGTDFDVFAAMRAAVFDKSARAMHATHLRVSTSMAAKSASAASLPPTTARP